MNDYIDYNNEEVSNYKKVVDPREHNVVDKIKSLSESKPIIIEDDSVKINQMKSTHHTIISESDSHDETIQGEIEDIKKEIDDEGIIIVGK